MKYLKKYTFEVVFVMVLIIIAILFSFRCYSSTIRADEFFSMGFANNTKDFLFLTEGVVEEYAEEGWLSGEFLHDWISVQEGEEFAIMPIHRNVRHDVHPPLYFMLLNAVCSFFTDKITLFPGYFINVCAGILTCIFMYLIGRIVFRNKYLAIVPVLVWAVSAGCTDAVEYLRMYAPLIALCTICLYFHLLFIEKEKIPKWFYGILLGITTIGTLTHYYYYVWMVGLFIMTILILLYRKQIKKLFFYGMSLLGGEIISFLAYPYVFKHLLFSERGVQVQENLENADISYYFDFFRQFMKTLNEEVYSGFFIWVAFSFGICFIVYLIQKFYKSRKEKSILDSESILESKNECGSFALISINVVCYLLILFKISYSAKWIYLSPVYPALVLITVAIFAFILRKITVKYYGTILIGVGIVLFFLQGILTIPKEIEEHHQIQIRHDTIAQYQEYCDVLFLYDQWNNLYDNFILELEGFHQIYAAPAAQTEMTNYQDIMAKRQKEENQLMVFIPTSVADYEKKVQQLAEEIGAKTVNLILNDSHAFYYMEM